MNIPTTMTLKLKPLRTLLRCHWLGKFAKPTYPVSFLRTMFLRSAAAAAAALGSFDATVCGAAPASEPVRSVVLALTEGEVLPLAMSGLAAGAGDGRLGGPPLVAVSMFRQPILALFCIESCICDCNAVKAPLQMHDAQMLGHCASTSAGCLLSKSQAIRCLKYAKGMQ